MYKEYNIFGEFKGKKYRQSALDFYKHEFGSELKKEPLKLIFNPAIKLDRIFDYKNERISEIKSASFIMKGDEKFDYFEMNYPIHESGMVPSCNLSAIVLHHTGNSSQIPNIIELHMGNQRGFDAIGYHFIIQKKGAVILTRPLKYQGAHVGQSTNKGKIGIALCNNLDEKDLDERMLMSCKNLCDYLKKKYNIQDILLHREVQIMKINEFLHKNGFEKKFIDEKIMSKLNSKEEFKSKKYKIVQKIIENNSDEKISNELEKMIKKLTTCPGINFKTEVFDNEKI